MSTRIYIVDDEQLCIDALKWDLEYLFEDIEIIATETNPLSALDFLMRETIDLLLLDIDMPDMNGFQLLKALGKKATNFQVVFVTAYNAYAIEAIKMKPAADYILKPAHPKDLTRIMGKVLENRYKVDMKIILKQIELMKEGEKTLIISTNSGYQLIPIKEIMYCKADGNYADLYLLGGKKITVSKTLKFIKESLNPIQFIRVHQSYLINKEYVREFVLKGNSNIVLETGIVIPVSRSYKNIVRKYLL